MKRGLNPLQTLCTARCFESQSQSVCVPYPSGEVTKSPISGEGRMTPFSLLLLLLLLGSNFAKKRTKGRRDGQIDRETAGKGRGNERRRVGRIIGDVDENGSGERCDPCLPPPSSPLELG